MSEIGKLSTILQFKNGKKRPEEEGTIPVYGGNGILGYTNESNHENCIAIGRVGAYCGSVYYEKNPCWISDNAIAALVKDNADIEYCYYLLQSQRLNERRIGTSQPLLTQGILNKIETTILPYEKQVKTGKFLGRFDEAIRLNEKINENLQQQVKALFKAWFVDFRPFGGMAPQNWTIRILGEVTRMGAGGDKPEITSSTKTPECPFPVYSNGINEYGLYGYTNEAKISAESVTVSARGTIGYVCLRHIPYVPIVRLITLIPDSNILSAKYLYLYLNQLNITGTGTTQQQLTVPDFRKTEILIPDKDTMDSFTKTVEPLFAHMWANEDENAMLASVRDTLLPKLMSGEIDVSAIRL